MAQIPLNQKIRTIDASVDTTERQSKLINSKSEVYTMGDIISTVDTLVGVPIIEQFNKAYVNYHDFNSSSVTSPPVGTLTAWPNHVKLETITTSFFSNNGLAHSNNRITNTSSTSKIVKLEGILSFIPETSDFINVAVAFFKNDTIILCSEQKGIAGVALQNEFTVVPFHCVVELEPNDYIEVWLQNLTDETNIVLDNINVIVTEL